MKQKGLTLVELLIVIFIIALLAGIAYAVLAPIRERARQTACVSNLKQVGVALHIYARDWNDYVPPYTNDEEASDGIYRSVKRSFQVNAQLYNPKFAVAVLDAYLKNKEVLFCPCDRWKGTNIPLNSDPHAPDPPGPLSPRNRLFTSYLIAMENAYFAPVHIYFQPRFKEEDFEPIIIPPLPGTPSSGEYHWVEETWYAECRNHAEHEKTYEPAQRLKGGIVGFGRQLHLRLKFDGRVNRAWTPFSYTSGAPIW